MLAGDSTRVSLYSCMSNNQYSDTFHVEPLKPTPSAGVKNGSVTTGVVDGFAVSTLFDANFHTAGWIAFMFPHAIGEPAEAWHTHFTPSSQNEGPTMLSNIHMKVASFEFSGTPTAPVHAYVTTPIVVVGHDITWLVVFTHHVLTFVWVVAFTTKHGPNREYTRIPGELVKYVPPPGQAVNPARITNIWGSVKTTGAPPAGSK